MSKYLYYNPNPKSLLTNDCVVRAFAYFFGVTWQKAFRDLIEWCIENGVVKFNYRSIYNEYLRQKDYLRHRAPRKGMTVAEFRDDFAELGVVYIVSIKRHLTIIHDKILYDTWDCSNEIVDGYWERR